MSISAVKWALNAKIGNATKKLVLVTIAESHNGKTGDCFFLSQKNIATVIDQDERSVRRHLLALETDGFITRKHRHDEIGHRTINGYILNLEVVEPTGHTEPVDYRTHRAGSEESLPDKSESLPDKKAPPAGHMVSGYNVPVTGRLEPEVSKSAPSATPDDFIIDDGPVDFTFKLWNEGTTILESHGVDRDRAKRMIGLWLKRTRNDHERVLAAIQFASGERTLDPIPLITAALKVDKPGGRRSPIEEAIKPSWEATQRYLAEVRAAGGRS
jgi:hypothetical protein